MNLKNDRQVNGGTFRKDKTPWSVYTDFKTRGLFKFLNVVPEAQLGIS